MYKTVILSIIILFGFQSVLMSQSHIWTGNGGDTNWFNAANWSANSVPASGSHVLIANNFTVSISDDTANVNTIELTNSATLILANNLTFSIEFTIGTAATLDWQSGSISGGGIIENDGLIDVSTQLDKFLTNTTLTNNNAVSIGDIGLLRLNESPIINNTSTGIFEIIGTGSLTHQTGNPVFNNDGMVKKTSAGIPGASYMILEMNNNGIIENDEDQTFLFLSPLGTLNNMETGRIQGSGVYDVTSPFNNVGTIAPGDDQIATIDFINNFDLSPESKLEFDLAGTNPGQYDVIAITGFPNLQGNILVNLEFVPIQGDEFTIITANNITSCDFPAQIVDNNGGPTDFLFDVICDNTSVKLRFVDEIIMGIDDLTSEEIEFFVHPNPVSDTFSISFNSSAISSFSSEDLSIDIYNQLGQEVKTLSDFTDANNTFQAEDLSKGIYFVQLRSSEKIIATTKMTVN